MFYNYLKMAWRSLSRNRLQTFINLAGLSITLSAAIIMVVYVSEQLNFDRFHKDYERIYRVSVILWKNLQQEGDSPEFVPPLGPAMKEEIPEIEAFTRISTTYSVYVSYGEKTVRVDDWRYVDSSTFTFFSFPLKSGNAENILSEPNSVVITSTLSKKLFGENQAVGQTIVLNGKDQFLIRGVAGDPPQNSHLHFSALASFSTLYKDPSNFMEWNGGNQYIAYVKLVPGTSPKTVEKKIPELMWKHINRDYAAYGLRLEPYLQALKDIHLQYESYSQALLIRIIVIGIIAFMVILAACINFINLAVAVSIRRSKEVGVRKVHGASRVSVVIQFLGESALICIVAFFGALFLIEMFMPYFENLIGISWTGWFDVDSTVWVLLGCILAFVILVAGLYPALYLSSLQPVESLKNISLLSLKKNRARSTLVVFQFTVCIALLVITFVVTDQIRFVENKSLGFERDNMVVIPLIGEQAARHCAAFKEELRSSPYVRNITASSEVPGCGFTRNGYVPEGETEPMMIHVVDVDRDFFDTYGIKIIHGRGFAETQDQSSYLVNESLAHKLNWVDPIGKKIVRNGDHFVIGVVDDFQFESLHKSVQPLIITQRPWNNRFQFLSVRIAAGYPKDAMDHIQRTWKKIMPDAPFEYWFLDESLQLQYISESQFRQLFSLFSALAVIIALLGLIGLTSFMIKQRTKEIGIRKVLGASVANVTWLLSIEFAKLVLLANLIAWPIAYLVMNQWLQNFAYRTEIHLSLFILSGATIFVLAFITAGFPAVRAASANPVEALKYE